jgi:hypothetical protein
VLKAVQLFKPKRVNGFGESHENWDHSLLPKQAWKLKRTVGGLYVRKVREEGERFGGELKCLSKDNYRLHGPGRVAENSLQNNHCESSSQKLPKLLPKEEYLAVFMNTALPPGQGREG